MREPSRTEETDRSPDPRHAATGTVFLAGPSGDGRALRHDERHDGTGDIPTRDEMVADLGHAYDYARARHRPVAFFCLGTDVVLGNEEVRDLSSSILDDMAVPKLDDLDLVIDSIGGDIHAAYRLVSLLYDRTRHFSACVPNYARSAATLLCVAADSLVLDDLAVLGPLDAQVYEDGNGYRPALTAFKTLERIRDFSLETLRLATSTIRDLNATSTDEALHHSIDFVRTLSQSMFEPMKANKIGEYSQALAVGERYGDRLYDRRDRRGMDRQEWTAVVSRLVNDYANHEVVIDYAELKHVLHLPVERFSGAAVPHVRHLAARPGMKRMVFYVDASQVGRDEWLGGEVVARLVDRERKRRSEAGPAAGVTRKASVYQAPQTDDTALGSSRGGG